MVRKAARVNQGDLLVGKSGVHANQCRRTEQAGVRASIVAMKRRNGRGAKGRRKAEA